MLVYLSRYYDYRGNAYGLGRIIANDVREADLLKGPRPSRPRYDVEAIRVRRGHTIRERTRLLRTPSTPLVVRLSS
jgi:hypothetical protein